MIFGYILGDGWIDKNGNCGISGDENSLRIIAEDIDKIYGEGTARKIVTKNTTSPKYNISGTTNSFLTRAFFSRAMQSLGMPTGKRCEQEYCIPNWILYGSYEIKRAFISGYYAAEGLIPSTQVNRKTPRPLSFPFNKNANLINNSRNLVYQFKSILADLGFNSTSSENYVTTNSLKIKQIITIENSEDKFLEALKMLDLRYCLPKEERRKQLLIYYSMKQIERERILAIHKKIANERRVNKSTYKELAEKYNLTWRQIEKILNGRSHAKQVRGFPRFDQTFIETYCLPKTPLNDETLSDFPADNDVPSL